MPIFLKIARNYIQHRKPPLTEPKKAGITYQIYKIVAMRTFLDILSSIVDSCLAVLRFAENFILIVFLNQLYSYKG